MTPKEKAKELYNKFNPHCLFKNFYGDDVEIQSTKQCALIAVDEIIDICSEDESAIITQLQYWQEVKNELLKQQNNG